MNEEELQVELQKENQILEGLAIVWGVFSELSVLHSWDTQEFMHAIHAAQSIVLSRVAMRAFHERRVGTQEPEPVQQPTVQVVASAPQSPMETMVTGKAQSSPAQASESPPSGLELIQQFIQRGSKS